MQLALHFSLVERLVEVNVTPTAAVFFAEAKKAVTSTTIKDVENLILVDWVADGLLGNLQ